MAYSAIELVYYVCKTLAEARMRVEELKRQGTPARIVRTQKSKFFEIRVPKRKESDVDKWRKSKRSNDIWRGPSKKDLEEIENLND